jgi:hypothetical protein
MKKTNQKEGIFAIIAALIVLFSAMLNPIVSVAISVVALIAFAVWEFSKK